MDQKRLLVAIAISIGILLLFDLYNRPAREAQRVQQQQAEQVQQPAPAPGPAGPLGAPTDAAPAAGEPAPRPPGCRSRARRCRAPCRCAAPGWMTWCCAATTRRWTANSPLVRLFAPREGAAPYYAQWGWTAADGQYPRPRQRHRLDRRGRPPHPGHPGDPAPGTTARARSSRSRSSLDDNYMVTAEQRVRNSAARGGAVLPWARIRRESTPPTQGSYILHEGFVGVLDGRLQELTYAAAKSRGAARTNGAGAGAETAPPAGPASPTSTGCRAVPWTRRSATAPPTAFATSGPAADR